MPKEIAIVAKSKDKATGKVTEIPGKCVQYVNMAEAVKGLGGEEHALNIINMQVKIRALDGLRNASSPSFNKLFSTASPEAQEKIRKLLGLV